MVRAFTQSLCTVYYRDTNCKANAVPSIIATYCTLSHAWPRIIQIMHDHEHGSYTVCISDAAFLRVHSSCMHIILYGSSDIMAQFGSIFGVYCVWCAILNL